MTTRWLQKMREFFALASENGLLADLRQRHYDHVESYEPVGTFTFMRQVRERLPAIAALFRSWPPMENDLDWRLLAAVGYQESHWNPECRVTHRRARRNDADPAHRPQLGVDDRVDPNKASKAAPATCAA
jgi:membrane-bound lytic murein transglycosylase F